MNDATSTLSVTLNGHAHRLPVGGTLAELLAQAGLDPQAVATAVNGTFVPRHARAERQLAPGDSVTGFQPIVGG